MVGDGVFRLAARKFYLTVPQCDANPTECRDRIVAKYGDTLVWTVVAQELHADGQPHLHVLIVCNKKYDYTGHNCFDWVANKHGKYESAVKKRDGKVTKPLAERLRYVTKDGNFVVWPDSFDPYQFIFKKWGKAGERFELIRSVARKRNNDGSYKYSLQEIRLFNPDLHFHNRAKLTLYVQDARQATNPDRKWVLKDPNDYSELWDKQIVRWLNLNLFYARRFKRKQLWIVASSNCGKSCLVRRLRKYCRVYDVPKFENFYDLYDDHAYDLCHLEELKKDAAPPLGWLNQFAEGAVMTLRVKGAQQNKYRNLPLIVTSTEEPTYVYNSPHAYEEINSRFWIVRVDSCTKIEALVRDVGVCDN